MDESGGGGDGELGGPHCRSLETQEAGPWERLNAAFDVFPRVKMIENLVRVHEDVTQNEQNLGGRERGGATRYLFFFFFFFSVGFLCRELFIPLKEYNDSLFSFNVAVQYGEVKIARERQDEPFLKKPPPHPKKGWLLIRAPAAVILREKGNM